MIIRNPLLMIVLDWYKVAHIQTLLSEDVIVASPGRDLIGMKFRGILNTVKSEDLGTLEEENAFAVWLQDITDHCLEPFENTIIVEL